MIAIAIFASGTGSNAKKIIDHFRSHALIKVSLIVCNNPKAGVIEIARQEQVPVLLLDKQAFLNGDGYLPSLQKAHIEWLILAGFLWKVPRQLTQAYPEKIVNIHPALLPKFGGKGMYGHHVHEAVIAAQEKESGITIHFVDDAYDHGPAIFQARCPVTAEDTPVTLAAKIAKLEHAHYPEIIERVILTNTQTAIPKKPGENV